MSTTSSTSSPPQHGPQVPHPPEFTILTRVAAIPIISSSLDTINTALLSNAFTRSSYATAKGLSTSAYKYTTPLQVQLAPLIIQADGYANKAVDVVESRYPYPFKVKPEEVAEYATQTIKAVDEKFRTPAYNVAQGIDQRFTPIVDYMEVAVTRLNSNSSEAGPSTPPDAKYQYQRVLALSKSLAGSLYGYSNDQLKQLQAQSVLVQRATETAHSITNLASSSLTSASTRIHGLSDTLLMELQKLQSSAASISASFQIQAAQLQNQIPDLIHQTYTELAHSLSSAVTDFHAIITTKDMPVQEKIGRVGQEVQDRVGPLLESVKKGISDILARGKQEATAAAPQPNGVNKPNGVNGTHHRSDSD